MKPYGQKPRHMRENCPCCSPNVRGDKRTAREEGKRDCVVDLPRKEDSPEQRHRKWERLLDEPCPPEVDQVYVPRTDENEKAVTEFLDSL